MRLTSLGRAGTAGILFTLLCAVHGMRAGTRATANAETRANDSANPTDSSLPLHATRTAPSDLEIAGELTGVPAGATRYVTLDSLLTQPLVTFTVRNDANFTGPTKITGIPLEKLGQLVGAKPSADLILAICDDKYMAPYPRAYILAHHPVLVLRVNGEPPARWPKDPVTHTYSMGPYMISNPMFTPGFKVLAQSDEAQIPWGVVRLEFRDSKTVFGAIAPRGPHANDAAVQAGYEIARQNCIRCHNAGDAGGQKAGRPWLVLAAFAYSAPDYFSSYVRNPKKENPNAQMPANPGYDDATIRALREYFSAFAPASPAQKP